MTTTTSKLNKGSRPRRSGRFQTRGYFGSGGNHHKPRVSEPSQTSRIFRDRDRTIEERRPDRAASRSAFISGARAVVPVLLALIPFAMTFGASATDSGLSALEA